MNDYHPIACAQHERLEYTVLRKTRLNLRLLHGEQLRVLPLDVYTRDSAEWLKYRRDDGVTDIIRLDQIAAFSEVR